MSHNKKPNNKKSWLELSKESLGKKTKEEIEILTWITKLLGGVSLSLIGLFVIIRSYKVSKISSTPPPTVSYILKSNDILQKNKKIQIQTKSTSGIQFKVNQTNNSNLIPLNDSQNQLINAHNVSYSTKNFVINEILTAFQRPNAFFKANNIDVESQLFYKTKISVIFSEISEHVKLDAGVKFYLRHFLDQTLGVEVYTNVPLIQRHGSSITFKFERLLTLQPNINKYASPHVKNVQTISATFFCFPKKKGFVRIGAEIDQNGCERPVLTIGLNFFEKTVSKQKVLPKIQGGYIQTDAQKNSVSNAILEKGQSVQPAKSLNKTTIDLPLSVQIIKKDNAKKQLEISNKTKAATPRFDQSIKSQTHPRLPKK